jgi:hypothetical protein
MLLLRLHLLPLLDEVDRRHALQLVAEVVADRRLQHLVDQVVHGRDGRDDPRRLGIGHVDLHLQIDVEDEPFS